MEKIAPILNYKILLQHFVASSSQLSYIDTRKEGINLSVCLSICLPLSVCILVLTHFTLFQLSKDTIKNGRRKNVCQMR